MTNSLTTTPAQARAIVLKAAGRNGWISQEDRDNSPPGTLEALQNAREQLGDALEIISHDLSSANARFAMELIQNAEDNQFTRARQLGQQPYVRFKVRPTSIIVECNEDGFLEDNVVAISRIGRSSKSKDRGYIGEKGIGFKSVFQVATNIHIQSNSFSFSFQYGEGATRDRLGIVTPILKDELIPVEARPLTRMTLTPFQAEEAIPYASLLAQFQEDIPDNLLLFLSTLEKIEIQCQLPGGRNTLTTFRKIEKDNGRMVHLFKSVGDPSIFTEPYSVDRYHIIKRDIPQLSLHTSRPGIDSCEVVLAFPVDEASRPLISMQSCFAFLPIRRTNFSFIIQADFILPANREDILHAARNIDILRGVAMTFRDAVLSFIYTDGPLRYKWMRYLPRGQPLSRVWEVLPTEIIRILLEEKILYAQDSPVPRRPDMLRILPSTHLDSSGLPLFQDLPGLGKIYLSLRYDSEDIDLLRHAFRLHDIEDAHMYHRIKQDLESTNSKMMGSATDEDWHCRAALLILSILSRSKLYKNLIQELPLIPLNNGKWVDSSQEKSYFPAKIGPEIPKDLITTVDPRAGVNSSRKALFTALGVSDVSPQAVIDKLFRHYSRTGGASELSLSMAHVSYLYWHHEDRDDHRLSQVWLYESHGRQVTSRRNLMYFQTAEEYGPYELLKAYGDPRDRSKSIPECPVSFLNAKYTTLFPPGSRRYGVSWLEWLEKALGVRRIPRIELDGGALSTEFRHIIRYRPDKVVGMLKYHWKYYDADMKPPIVDTLSQSEVTCLGGQLRALKDTYLPLQHLRDMVQTLGIGQNFPFLKVADDIQAIPVLRDWGFLTEFKVGFELQLNFYVEVLRQHKTPNFSFWKMERREQILKTYELIADNCTICQREGLCKQIDTRKLILDPCSFEENAIGPTWIDIQSCSWRGPIDLLAKKPLAEVPEYRNNKKLSKFFRETLEIGDATWRDYLEMVSNLRKFTSPFLNVSEKTLKLYRLLLSDGYSKPNWTQIRERFQNEGLIYIPSSSSWVSPSECLWDSPVLIEGKSLILQSYPEELKPFFTERLQVAVASMSTLTEELFTLATRHPTVQEVKGFIWAINAMSPRPNDMSILSTCNFLPVRISQPGAALRIEFRACQDEFAIIDRSKLAEIFEGRVELLDFSLEEVIRLDPFLRSLGLGSKYLSLLCREKTHCQGESLFDHRISADFNDRAHDLLRCAVSCRSEIATLNPESIFNKLRNSIIFRTNGIMTTYTIQRSGKDIHVQKPSGDVHIKEQEDGYNIYVPQEERERAICYSLSFPQALTELFGIPPKAREIISNVLNKPISILDDILQAEGIGMVPGIAPLPRPAYEDSAEEETGELEDTSDQGDTSEQEVIGVEHTVASLGPRAQETLASNDRRSQLPPAAGQVHDSLGQLSREIADERTHDLPDSYRDLLGHVIRLASQTSLPHLNSRATVGTNQFLQGFNHVATFGIRSQGQMNHDTKIGAAGELFVFEILSALLPQFDQLNWESTIRGLVATHPRYTGMHNWQGRETADITYNDQSGAFTAILITKGYLEEQVWKDARPKYFIEVKTTTGECSDRFYISGKQYLLMQRYTLPPGGSVANVYIIFRVFNLGRDNLSMKLYVDPEAHRLRGDLLFESQTWTVQPHV